MQLKFIKLSSLFLLLFSVNVFATDTALILHSNFQDAHTNVKAQLEEDGYTVTLSTSGSVPENLINNYDVVFDLKFNNNIGGNGKTRYAAFVNAGGILTLVGENDVSFSNDNNTIEAFINNTLSATIAIQGTTGGGNCGNGCNMTQTNTSAGVSNYSSVGVYPYGAYFTGNGTWVVKSTSGKILWMKWSGSQLPSGYSGEVYVTFDINQFTSSYDNASTDEFIGELYATSTPQSAISSSQTTIVNTTKSKTGNGVYINQSGGSLDLDIVQDGDNNLIIGTDLTSNATITGNSNTVSITQNNDNNVLGLDLNGNSNNLTILQNKDQRALIDIVGNSNTLTLDQLHLLNVGDHFTSLNIAGSSNNLNLDQKESGDKTMFLDIDSSNNVTVLQEGTGDHFLDLNITDNHTVNVTQDGTGDHSATIGLTGNTSTLNLTQDSSTDQNYHLQQNCVASSCSATVTQN